MTQQDDNFYVSDGERIYMFLDIHKDEYSFPLLDVNKIVQKILSIEIGNFTINQIICSM